MLVVTDDAELGDEARSAFPDNTEVAVCVDSRQASKFMLDRTPSALIAEIRTGSAGGVGLTRDMSQRELLKDVPVLMLLERPQDRWLALQAGASATLLVPIEASEIVSATMALLPHG